MITVEESMKTLSEQIKIMAESKGLEFKDKGKGHLQIISGKSIVNYYPESKRQTAHNSLTGEKLAHASPEQAIELCVNAVESAQPWHEFQTNPAGIKHFYEGDRPAWDFDRYIGAQSDRDRIAAYRLRRKANDLEERADYQDGIGQPTPLQQVAREMQARLGL
jgi:hypothetical protein